MAAKVRESSSPSLDEQSTQVFENLAKKLHRLESKLGETGCRLRCGCVWRFSFLPIITFSPDYSSVALAFMNHTGRVLESRAADVVVWCQRVV